MSVLIVIPTVTGRESFLADCEVAYKETTPDGELAFYITTNRPTCGEAWNNGAKFARELGVDYVHMTADDLIPHAGWYEAAVETVSNGNYCLPGALIYKPNGEIEDFGNREGVEWEIVAGASVPFCKTDHWIDIPNIHYWSDNAFDYAQKELNEQVFVRRKNYAFTHHTAQVGRKLPDQVERTIFEEWKKTHEV